MLRGRRSFSLPALLTLLGVAVARAAADDDPFAKANEAGKSAAVPHS